MKRRYSMGPTALIAIAAFAAAACSHHTTAPNSPGGHADTIVASGSGSSGYNTTYSFSPTPDTITAGTTLYYEFQDVTHTVIWDNPASSPDSIPPAQNVVIGLTFPTAGTFTYHCRIHPYMTGAIVVQ